MHFTLADFSEKLVRLEAQFVPIDTRVMDPTGAGGFSIGSYGHTLWRGKAIVASMPSANARVTSAMLAALRQSDASFEVMPPAVREASDVGLLQSVQSDRRLCSLTNVAPQDGDWLAFASGGVRSLHQVLSVNSGVVTVVPAIPRSIAVNAVASLAEPIMNAITVQDGPFPSFEKVNTSSFELEFVQDLRPKT